MFLRMCLAICTGAFLFATLPSPSGAGDEGSLATQLRQRIVQLRVAGHFAEAVALADELRTSLLDNGQTRRDEMVDADWLLETVQLLASLPHAEREIAVQVEESTQAYASLLDQRAFDRALPILLDVVAGQRRLLGDEHPETARTITDIARVHAAMGSFEPADSLFEYGLAMQRRTLHHPHPVITKTLIARAQFEIARERYARADSFAHAALSGNVAVFGATHENIIKNARLLATIRQLRGDLTAAEFYLRRALSIAQAVYSTANPERVRATQDLAEILARQGYFDEAATLYRDVLGIQFERFGEHHIHVALLQRDLAGVLFADGLAVDARELYRRSLQGLRNRLGEDHEVIAHILHQLGLIEASLGNARAADEHLRRSLRAYRRLHGAESPSVAAVSLSLGALRERQGRLGEARVHVERALDAYAHDPGPASVEFATALFHLARLLCRESEFAQARTLLTEACATFDRDASTHLAYGRELAPGPYELLALVHLEMGEGNAAWAALDRDHARDSLPRVAELPRGGDDPSLDGVQSRLDAGEVILGWLDVLDRCYLYVVPPYGDVLWYSLPSGTGSDVELEYVRMAGNAGSDLDSLTAKGIELYEHRFTPIDSFLRKIRRLHIQTRGSMASVPVEMLPIDSATVIGDVCDVSYMMSAADLARSHERTTGLLDASLFAIADPPFTLDQARDMYIETHNATAEARSDHDSQPRRDVESATSRIGELPRLKLSRTLVDDMADIFATATVWVGTQACEAKLVAAVETGDLATYDYIHFATYAIADAVRPERSFLVLSQADMPDALDLIARGEAPADGQYSIEEIMSHWTLHADVVTITAYRVPYVRSCSPSRSFANGILRSGACSVLVNRWNVAEQAAHLLLERFYENRVRRNLSKTEALGDARRYVRSYRTETGETPYQHPAFWAGFMLVGDAD